MDEQGCLHINTDSREYAYSDGTTLKGYVCYQCGAFLVPFVDGVIRRASMRLVGTKLFLQDCMRLYSIDVKVDE